MVDAPAPWTATVRLELGDVALAGWVESSLRPEAAREVPRAGAEIHAETAGTLEVTISARDSGALRAALNTYLGWIHLSLTTARTARRSTGVGRP